MKVKEAIDTLFSHNEEISLWYDKQNEEGHYSSRLWKGIAWVLPDKYKGLQMLRIFGTIPEHISEADTINLLVKYQNNEAKFGSTTAIDIAPVVRCKECKYREYECSIVGRHNDDFYCADGKKKDDNHAKSDT